MNDASIYPYHPVANYIRAYHMRTSWVWNNKVKCRVPNSDELADRLEVKSQRMSDRSSRVELMQYSTREDVPARAKVYVRSIAFGKRGINTTDMCVMFQGSWIAPAVDYLLGHERRRVDRDEERLLKKFRKTQIPLELLIDYLNDEPVEDIIILADMEED